MIFNHIKIREKKKSLQTDKTIYEIIKNIRTKVGQKLHPYQIELQLFNETVLCALLCFFVCLSFFFV